MVYVIGGIFRYKNWIRYHTTIFCFPINDWKVKYYIYGCVLNGVDGYHIWGFDVQKAIYIATFWGHTCTYLSVDTINGVNYFKHWLYLICMHAPASTCRITVIWPYWSFCAFRFLWTHNQINNYMQRKLVWPYFEVLLVRPKGSLLLINLIWSWK